MMKRPEFLETKRTPRYSLRKLNVGVASVLLGVTIFGINFTDHSVKAATNNLQQQPSAAVSTTANNSIEAATTLQSAPKTQGSADTDIKSSAATVDQNNTNTQKATSETQKVQQSSASNNTTANNSKEAATTPQSSPETQGSADTDIRSLDIRSLTAISAAKLATMNLMQTNGINGTDTDGNAAGTPGTVTGADRTAAGTPSTNTGSDRSAAVTVNPDNINTQPAKENQKLANEHNLSSSDNYSSNIYKGTDGKYYKIVTIYGNDYVYHAADIQASGANWRDRPKQTAEDTKNNISISKEDLGNGQTRWTVTFFPKKGLQNVGSKLSGLSSAKFGIALTSDYQIVGNVDMKVISDPNQIFDAYTFEPGSTSATEFPIQNLKTEKDFSFNPKTDVDPNTGLINSETMPAYNNQYLQPSYYFTTATDIGKKNLWQTYFKDADERKNAYDGSPYLGGNHDFHFNTFKIANETGVDGAKYNDPLIYDTRGGVNGVFSSDNFTQAMEFKSQGVTNTTQFSSYVISFTTQHTDSHEVELATGSGNQQFSGISANIYSFQNAYTSKMSSLYGEQRALNAAGATVEAKKIIPHWGDVKPYMDKIKQDYLNNAQINVLRNKILNNITHPDALNNIVSEGNSLNDAMKNLGNSIGQYDPNGSFAGHKEDTTKASDRYKYANPKKKAAYDNATEVTKALINKDTGTYADQAKVEKLTNEENTAWSALDGKKPTDAESDKVTAKDGVSVDKGAKVDPGSLVNVTDPAGKPVELKPGSVDWKEGAKPDLSTSGDKTGKVEVTLPDGSKTEVPVHLHVKSDAESDKVTAKDGVSVDKGAKVDPGSLVNVTDPAGKPVELKPGSVDWKEGAKPDLSTSGDKTGKVEVTLPDGSKTEVPVHLHVKSDAESDKVTAKDGVSVDKGAKVDPGSLVNVTDPAGKPVELKPGSVDWKEGAKPDLSTSGDKTGKVEVTLPDGSKTEVPVHLHVKSDAESDKVTAKDGVSVDKGAKVDPGSLVNVTDPAGKPVELPAGSIDWKEGAKPDLSTYGDKTGKVEVTFLDGSKKDTDVTIHVKTDAETYDPKAQPWTTTVGKTPKADEVISSTDKNGKKMPSDAKYTWETEPNTSKTGEAFGEVKVTYSDGSHDDVPVTINVKDKDKLNDKEKYHIYGKDGLKVDNGKTLDPKDTIVVKDIDGNQTTLPEGSTVKWTKGKEPDFSQAGKDVTGEVTVTYPDHTQSDSVTVTVHVNGESDEYKVAPRDGVTVQRGGQVDPESTVVAQTPDGKPTSFPDGTKHEWITKPDTDSTGKRTGVVKTTFQDGSTTTTTVSVTVEPNQSDEYDPHGPENPDDRVPVKDPEHLTDGDKNNVKGEVGKVNPDLPKGTEVTVDDKGNATIKYPDGSKDTIKGGDLVRPENDADKNDPKGPENPDDRVPVKDPEHLTDGDKNNVKGEVGKVNPDLPKGTEVTVDDKGNATIKYPDGSKDTIKGGDLVRPENDADKNDPKGPENPDDRVPVKDPEHLTDGDKNNVKGEVGKVNPDLPKGTEVTVDDKGNATIKYPDGSKDTIKGGDLVRPENDADKNDPKGPENPDDRVPVKDPEHLTDGDKNNVKGEVGKVNPDLPKGTEVTVDDKGNATIKYPDGSKDTIKGGDLVRPENDADKNDPKGPENPDDRVPVKDPEHLTDGDKNNVKGEVGKVNPDLPKGTEVTVDDKGNATIKYPDGSKDTIKGGDLVRPENDADKNDPKGPENPDDRVPVKDPEHLTDGDKNNVKGEVGKVNPDLPKGTEVTVDDKGNATIKYPDGSKDTIKGGDLVRPENDADKNDPKGPENPDDRVPVKDPEHLTDGDKNNVKGEVGKVNPDLPKGTEVTVDDKGNATIKYPDGSKDTIKGGDLVRPENDADKNDPKGPENPDDRVPVKDPEHLTDGDKNNVKGEVGKVNPDLPKGTEVTVDDKGNATIKYPDGSKDTIKGGDLVRPENDADKNDPKGPENPDDRVPVKDPEHLTDGDKNNVKGEVGKVNPDLPKGTEVTVDDKGNATIKYPDGSKDTIKGGDLVRPENDADKNDPKGPENPDDRVPVKDPEHLTDGDKNNVKGEVGKVNPDLPKGTEVTVDDKGNATIKYPDGSKDTIKGGDLVRPENDADKNDPKGPENPDDRVPVKDPEHLTDGDKNNVKGEVGKVNPDLPKGTEVTVDDKGNATIKYPDGSKDTIKGGDLVRPENDADKNDPKGPENPDDRVPVKDPEHLTDGDKNNVKGEVGKVNPDLPKGTEVTVDDKGNATIKYPDGSKDTIKGGDLVRPENDADKTTPSVPETDAEKITPNVPGTPEPVANTNSLTETEKAKVQKNVEDANKGNFPDGTKVDVGADGTATITYPDKSTDTIPGSKLVRPEKDADKTTPSVPETDAEKITPNVPGTPEPVANTNSLTETEKAKVQKNVEDANKGNFPDGTKVDVGADGTATITYPDKSTDTIPGSKLVRPEKDADKTTPSVPETDAEKITPNVPGTPEPVANTNSLTETEKAKVQKNVEDANKGNFPDGTKVDVGADGTATITYPDKSTDTIPGSKLVRPEKDADKTTPSVPETDAEKITPNVPGTPEPVANTNSLTETEKAKVQKNVEDANKGNFPDGTKVDVGADGTATITYPDKSTDTIPGSKLVRPEKDADKTTPSVPETDAEKITPNVPGTPEPVANTNSLTETEKAKVQKNVEDANKGNFPDGTKVDVGADGTATITYPDKSTDTIKGSDLVRPENDADKTTPNVPEKKEPVADTGNLTETEKDKVKKNVEDANKGNFPDGTTVTVGNDGTTTVTYPDQSTDTIKGSDLVRPENDADKTTPNVPEKKEPVADTGNLTETEKDKVKKNVEDANKGNFPDGTTVTVGNDGTTTVTYPDQSTDTIKGSDLVRPENDADKTTPNVPGDKVTVKDPSHLTDDEKKQVKNNVDNANKDKFPAGTEVTVGDDGTATVTYPDGSKDTIPGDQLVQGQKGDTTDAGKITPTVPGDKVTVKDPSHLTDDEKKQVKNNVDNANKDKFPAGTEVTVGDDGTATVTYPDGSKDTIPGDQLVQGQKGDTTDAGKITPTVSGDKVTVKDPSHLTDDEKKQVKNNVDNANKDKFPAGTKVTVGDDGTTTVTYPDGSKDTIPGSDLVRQSTDADKTTPSVPATKVPVTNPSHLTDSEKDQVKTNVTNANKDTLPSGSQVTVGDDGTATITYPDGSKDTIPGRDLIKGISGNKHDSNSSSGSNGTISNTDDETSGDTVNNAESMNGNTAKSGSKNNSLKTLPQTGTKDVTILEILGLFLSLFGLLGLKKKHHEE